VGQHHDDNPERILDAFIDALFAMGPLMKDAIIVLCPEHLEHFRAAGWAKSQVGQYLHENARRSVTDWAFAGRPVDGAGIEGSELVSALVSPESVITVVAGGGGGAWSQIIPTWTHGRAARVVTKSLPA